MANFETVFKLHQSETIVHSLKGNAYTTSANPIVRLIMLGVRFLNFVVGVRKIAEVTVTDQRLIIEMTNYFLWIFVSRHYIRSTSPRSINGTAYSMERMFIFFKSHYLELSTAGYDVERILSKQGVKGVVAALQSIDNLADRVTRN